MDEMRRIGQIAMGIITNVPAKALPQRPLLPPAVQPNLMNKVADFEIPAKLWSNWIPDIGLRTIVRALRDDERAIIERRASELDAGLIAFNAEAETEKINSALFGMLAGFRAMRSERGDDADNMVAVLRVILKNYPAWAIIEACNRIGRNEAGFDPRYAPNDTEIERIAHALVEPYRKALKNAQALLAAPIEGQEPGNCSGEPLGAGKAPIEPPKPAPGDGKHMERVMADLAARKAQRDAGERDAVEL